MKKSLIIKLYEKTNLENLPKVIKKEILDVLNIWDRQRISDKLVDNVNNKVSEVLEEKWLENRQIKLLLQEIEWYSYHEHDKDYDIQFFKGFYWRTVTKEDLKEILDFNEKALFDNVNYEKTIVFSEVWNEDYRKIILWWYKLQYRFWLMEDIYKLIWKDFDNKEIIKTKLFQWFLDDNKLNYLKDFIEQLWEIDWFSFEWIEDISMWWLMKYSSHEKILEMIEFLNIKNIRELWEDWILYLSNLWKGNSYNDIDDEIELIMIFENLFWIEMDLEKVNNWWMKLFSELSKNNDINKILDREKIEYCKIYFSYFDFNNQDFSIDENINKWINLFNFVLSGNSTLKYFSENDFERKEFQLLIKEIEEKMGFEINFDSFSEVNFSDFLNEFIGEVYLKKIDKRKVKDNNEEFDKNNERYKYSRFFNKFSKYSYYWNNSEIVEDNWSSKEYFLDDSGIYYKILKWVNFEFINLFIDNFEYLVELIDNKWFDSFYWEKDSYIKNNIVSFIKLLRKLWLEIKLSNIDIDFIKFCKIWNRWNFTDITLNNFEDFEKWFFDDKITWPEYFYDKESLEAQVLLKEDCFYVNLLTICQKFNLPITILNFKTIEKNYLEEYNLDKPFFTYLTDDYYWYIEEVIDMFWDIQINELLHFFIYSDITLLNRKDIFNKIINNPKWIHFWYFAEAIKNEAEIDVNNLLVTKDNFLDFMGSDEVLISFDKDAWFRSEWIVPWSKSWFLEKPERKEYLNPENISTFKKFGTIIWLWLIEWSQNSKVLWKFYEHIFNQIDFKTSRSSILQLWELFNLILKKEKYELLDELVDNEEDIWNEFKDFIEEHCISDKWRTILTLMIASEINSNFQIFNDENGKKQVDNSSVKEMLLQVFVRLMKYKPIIDLYKNVPIKTSIWVELEITQGIADWYKAVTNSDYKNDIEILSEYSWIAKGNDAVHEIATKPTDNPYLLLLELCLLEKLDFLDLNFKKEDYSRWARGLHITVWWEYWVKLYNKTHFIQNILIASNLWALNVWDFMLHDWVYYYENRIKQERWDKWDSTDIKIDMISDFISIRQRWNEVEALFDKDNKTPAVETKWLTINNSESFERLILSIYNLSMGSQMIDKFLKSTSTPIHKLNTEECEDYFKNNSLNYPNEKQLKLINLFYELENDIYKVIKSHNSSFLKNESFESEWEFDLWLEKLLKLWMSNSPFIKLLNTAWMSFEYLKSLFELWIETKDDFINKLSEDSKFIVQSERQLDILYWNYNLKIKPIFKELKENKPILYNDLLEYLKFNSRELERRLINKSRFKEVIWNDERYLESIKIDLETKDKYWYETWEFELEISPELVQKFIKINNLYIKKDSTNALAMFDTTKEPNWDIITDSRLTETMIFDKIDRWLSQRKWYNIIQWASEHMLTQAIQKIILKYNDKALFLMK